MAWPASDRFRVALGGSGADVARVDILDGGEPVATIDGTTPAAGDLISGTIRVSRSVVRRTGDVTFADPTGVLSPVDARSLLVPLRGEIRVWKGVRFTDATWAEQQTGDDVEVVPVATLVVVDVDIDGARVEVTGYDRMHIVAESRFPAPYVVEAGTNIKTALVALLTDVVPSARLATNFPDTDLVTGALVFDTQDSPADAATALATAAGWSLYADPMGTITAVSEADVTAENVTAGYVYGTGSMLLRAKRGLSGQGVFNAVVATGEAADLPAPVRGYAEDTDPESVTYAAEIGVFPRFYGSPLLRTNAQALLAAQTILRREGGIADTVAISAIPDPTLEAGDVISVNDGRIVRLLQADQFNVGLTAGPQEIVCRSTVLH